MEKSCPLGHECHRCLWLVKLRGTHPQTGQEVDREECAMTTIPLLLLENSRQQLSTGAAVENFRNEMVKGNAAFLGMLQQRQAIDDEIVGNQMRMLR
jgi:hypothetical protein